MGRFHVKSITQKPDHLQFCSNLTCQFIPMSGTPVPIFRQIGQVFFELCPSQKIKFDPENRA